METVHIAASGGYDVRIGPGLLRDAGKYLTTVLSPCRAAIITDDRVAGLFGDQVMASLSQAGFPCELWQFPQGERQKNLSTFADVLEWLGERRFSRGDVVVALGGGVPGDLAGFAAAVYCRGLRLIQIPTTLLAAVDSSVGGKTAVDLRAGKNLAGAFHQPELVLCDTDILGSLPPALLRDGAAEIIKYGVLCDPALFQMMGTGAWKSNLDQIVARCVTIKRDYVERDERDNGARQYLNLGHTFGHAVEKCSGYTLTHGQGVAIGLVLAARAAGMDAGELMAVCASCGLPTVSPYSAQALAEAALTDKKRRGEDITLVLPQKIGECRLDRVPVDRLPALFSLAVGERT